MLRWVCARGQRAKRRFASSQGCGQSCLEVVQQGLRPAWVFEAATEGGTGRRTASNVYIHTEDRHSKGCPALQGGATGNWVGCHWV